MREIWADRQTFSQVSNCKLGLKRKKVQNRNLRRDAKVWCLVNCGIWSGRAAAEVGKTGRLGSEGSWGGGE